MFLSAAERVARRARYAAVLAGALALAGCAGMSNPFESSPPPAAAPVGRPSIAPSDIIGRWGIASYHREQDRARTETAARGQCKQPYVISGGGGGGVMMLNHDSPNIVEHLIKATADNKTYLGPGAEPGGADDREVLSFDGRVLTLKWVDPEVQSRYGIMVLVRCGAEGTAPPPAPRRAAAPARAAAPPPPVMRPPGQ
jgi:hypothetical protein